MPRKNVVMIIAIVSGVLLVAAFMAYRQIAGAGLASRTLLELGDVAVPRRLEDRAPDVTGDRVVFRFDRIAGGFRYMGSVTPVRERLAIMIMKPDVSEETIAAAIDEFRWLAADRIERPSWQADGVVEIGEGRHVVNGQDTPARVVILRDKNLPFILSHMGWTRDHSREESVALLHAVAASFRRKLSDDAFFSAHAANGYLPEDD